VDEERLLKHLVLMDQRMERMKRSLAVEPKGSAYLTADEAADYIKVHVETLRSGCGSASFRTFRYRESGRITASAESS
jgi:hypothetical protein